MKSRDVILLSIFILFHIYRSEAQRRFHSLSNDSIPDIGVYYYPEQWEKSEWDRDLKKMHDLGFTFTHVGEFSWSMLEPKEGHYDFKWLDEFLVLADKYKLKVILCTPTPAPPSWLSTQHPGILIYNSDGIQMKHGSRQHASWSSDVYKNYVKKMVLELVKKYGKDKRIWGWQLDNEPSHYNTIYDYNPSAENAFKKWLKNKYQVIDSLNKRWGNSFWSQNYTNFNQIRIPNSKQLVQPANPHALLDFQEFTNEERGSFLRLQAQVLRENILPEQFITTNYMMQLPHLDPWINVHDLDFASYTNYPVNSYSNIDGGEVGFRLGSGIDLSFSHEFFESVNGYTGIMELQPGQVNWGQYNCQPLPGAVRMWIWHTIGLGSKFVCTYRFKQPLFGNEQYHNGIIGTDGITLSRGGQEFIKIMNEINLLKKNINHSTKKKNPPVAILFDQRSLLDMHNFPHTNSWDGVAHLKNYYAILKSFGLEVVFITKDEALDVNKYPVVIAPSLQLVSEEMLSNWKRYVEKGGNLILTCRTGQKNRDGHLWKAPLQSKLPPLTGYSILYNDQLPKNKLATVVMNDSTYSWNVWGDVIGHPIDSIQSSVLATYKDQFYSGKPAAVHNTLGKGVVTYIGVQTWTTIWKRK